MRMAVLAIAMAAAVAACATVREATEEVRGELEDRRTATATMIDRNREPVGTVELEEEGGAVELDIDLNGLEPGLHAIHIHEAGRCDPPAFTSAGGHFNPENRQHGFNDPQGPHAGDLPNIEIRGDGTVDIELQNERVTLTSGANALLDGDGAAIVVHAGHDDHRTNPAGAAGDRVACGVVRK